MSIKLSKSSVNSYVLCPRQFKYVYIDNNKPEPSAAAQLGIDVHDIAELFVNLKKNFDSYDSILKQLLEFEKEKDNDCKVHCENLAEFFYEMFILKEYKFFKAEEYILNEEYNFSGFFDLVLEDKEGKLFVIDYKSGSASSVDKYKLELCYYKMLIESKYPDKEVKNAAIYFTKQGILSSMEFSEDKNEVGYCSLNDYNLAIQYINTIRIEIDTGLFPARRGSNCKFCTFGEECAKDSGLDDFEVSNDRGLSNFEVSNTLNGGL